MYLQYFYLIITYVAIIPTRILFSFGGKKREWRRHIYKNIYLGGYFFFPSDYTYLRDNNIKVVINLVKELPSPEKRLKKMGVNHYYLPLPDKTKIDEKNLRQALEVVSDNDNKNILIHCAAGQSRSAYLVYRVLQNVYNMSDQEAKTTIMKEKKVDDEFLI